MTHSETLANHDLLNERYKLLDPAHGDTVALIQAFADDHRKAIARFGRYPHRCVCYYY